MEYVYEAMDAMGMETQGIVEADDEGKALDLIRQMGYFATEIHRCRKSAPVTADTTTRKKLQIAFKWRWYDFWVGWYFDRKERHLYIGLLPTMIFEFWFAREE